MSTIPENLNQAELEKTVNYFKDMGFSDKYVEQLERDLSLGRADYVRSILDNIA